MKRKEKIENYIEEYSSKVIHTSDLNTTQGVTTKEIGAELTLDFNNVNRDCNQLHKEGVLIKVKQKPVRFFSRRQMEGLLRKPLSKDQLLVSSLADFLENSDPFKELIGHKQSLRRAIKKAKSAMIYPPNGLHTILQGPSGVGKTTFAQKMFEYAKQSGTIDCNGQFISFNCSEYADNGDLLFSHLFGHVEGAFTGANKEKEGLVSRANNGVLFLDEVHRLSFQSQEMLFQLIDKGQYRKLGSSNDFEKSQVLIICATTENLEEVMLKTLLRRIPVTISLPSLGQKDISEKLDIVDYFLKMESKNLKSSISITHECLKGLIFYNPSGNIGQLKSDIKMICARAYLEGHQNNSGKISIREEYLPDSIQKEILNSHNIPLFSKMNNYIIFDYLDDKNMAVEDLDEEAKKMKTFEFDEYIRTIMGTNAEKRMLHKSELLKFVDRGIYNNVQFALNYFNEKRGFKSTQQLQNNLSIYLQFLYERLRSDHFAVEFQENVLEDLDGLEISIAKMIRVCFEQEFFLKVPDQELLPIIEIIQNTIDEEKVSQRIPLIIIAHGNSTATSIASFVNELLGIKCCYGIDMPLSMPSSEMYDKTKELLKEVNTEKGALLLVDMGSLVNFSAMLAEELQINIVSIDRVTTALALEAGMKCSLIGITLEKLESYLASYSNYISRNSLSLNKGIDRSSEKAKPVIIVSCSSGTGTAQKISDYLKENYFQNELINQLEIVPLGEPFMFHEMERVIATIGTVDIKAPNIPFISMNDMMFGNGFNRLETIIFNVLNINLAEKSERSPVNSLVSLLKESLEVIDAEIVLDNLRKAYKITVDEYPFLDKNANFYVRYILHTSFLVERVQKNEILENESLSELKEKFPKQFQLIKSSVKHMEDYYSIEIPESEIAYIVEMILENL
ncbi:sigma 54-interacting transcriptional regulator [Enterococcus pallens]|uniref:Uncharacterized protein n=1 Tax=Enterococcus pallens ATCC BAA-351 TaxID=1158607 RepID=R2PV85_9ENTE|nr:sigma 54-interacting transcriptional regulator [Enterococcus pallens]EOH88437.1 hypothetical protein UAU_04255 [Enterococcus pallens ATCC BAA-351]EOU17618.1 hypothetical protein I588_02604 [Enterococcus pallens ATCC BAA-351]